MPKKIYSLFLVLALALPLPALAQGVVVTDGAARAVTVPLHARAVVLLGSYAQAYVQAGGQLLGATEDYFTPGEDSDVTSVGAAHHPSLEGILKLDPQVVVLSNLHKEHLKIGETLTGMGIPCLYYEVTRYEQYLTMLRGFCLINDTGDIYEAQRRSVADGIQEIVDSVRQDARYGHTTCLLLRVYATGVRSKAQGTIAGEILADMGLQNIAEGQSGTDLISMEAVMAADPDYIFLVAMGADEQAAQDMAQRTLYDHPAWAGLSAVQNTRVYVLDKRLFHNKPNADWPQAYQWVAATVYGQP